MKYLAPLIILLILVFCYAASITIKIKPFKIAFDSLPSGVGVLLIIFAIACFHYQGYRTGKKEGYKEAIESVKEALNPTDDIPTETVNPINIKL